MDIVLVGNARSLLERPDLGAKIDAFSVVVRFNNYVTRGFENCVGSRCDWWARNETDEVLPRSEYYQKIILRLQGEDEAIYHRGGRELVPALQAQHPGTPIEVIPRAVFVELLETCRFARGPLTGTAVIAHLLKTYPRLHVCGFDNLMGTPETLRHYYSDVNIIDDWTTYHEPDKEAAYLYALIQQGRVVPL